MVCLGPSAARGRAAWHLCWWTAALDRSSDPRSCRYGCFCPTLAGHALLVTSQWPPDRPADRSGVWAWRAAAAWRRTGSASCFSQSRSLRHFSRYWHTTNKCSTTLIGSSHAAAPIICITMVYRVLQILNKGGSLFLVAYHPKLEGLQRSCYTWSMADQDAELGLLNPRSAN